MEPTQAVLTKEEVSLLGTIERSLKEGLLDGGIL